MLTVVPGEGSGREGGKDGSPSLIDEIVREGARRMLAEALRAEVDAYVAAFAAERDESGPPTSITPARTCWPSPGITRNASTRRSAAAPMWSASSPAVKPSSGSSAPSWPSGTTNGPQPAATWDWRSSPVPQNTRQP